MTVTARIRPLEREDLPAVASLVARRFPDAPPLPDPEGFFSAVLLDHPWADPEIPSLVAVDPSGSVVGFIGAHVRRLRAGPRELRAAGCSHLAVEEQAAGGAAGALLLGRFMAGPQDLSFSDTAIGLVERMWKAFGGRLDPVRSLAWMAVLRPRPWAARIARRRVQPSGDGWMLVPVRTVPLATAEFDDDGAGLASAPLAPADAAAVELGLDLAVDYDEAWLGWALPRLRRPVARVVRRGSALAGWYVMTVSGDGAGRVLEIAARPRQADAVVGRLFADARAAGCVVLGGRVEPHLVEPLRRRGCSLGFGDRFMAHARETELLDALAGERSLLSRLSGEFW
jgi:hypothetical protein